MLVFEVTSDQLLRTSLDNLVSELNQNLTKKQSSYGKRFLQDFHLIQHVKLRQNTKFRVYNLHNLKDIEEDSNEDWVQVTRLNIALGAFFEVGSAFNLIQHVKLCTCTNFHTCIIKCTIQLLRLLSECTMGLSVKDFLETSLQPLSNPQKPFSLAIAVNDV